MKSLYVIVGLFALIANVLIGLIVSSYPSFNVGLNSAVIVLTTLLLFVLSSIKLKDAFKISLTLLTCILGCVEFFLGLFANDKFENNWYLVVLVILLLVQGALFMTSYVVSNYSKE
ncbi:MAG: hypothetical protein MJZ34_15230 [Paludibacteraceae bacterium]|nr:hypothetical protein [Paludibacteraceae bacterium]